MHTAETLIVGAVARTLDPRHPKAHAVAIVDGAIVGLDDEALALRGGRTDVIDLGGASLVPGLVDGHMHPILGVTLFDGVDLPGCRDLDDVRGALSQTEVPAHGWVRGYGLDHNVFAGAPLTSAVLEDALPGVAVFIRFFDGHSALASSTALRRSGVDGPRAFVQRSMVACDEHDRPTGHLLEHAAMDLVERMVPSMAAAEQPTRVLDLLHAMAATGLTAAHVMDGNRDALALLADLETTADLPMRLRLAPWCMPGDDLDELVRQQGQHGRQWSVDAVKFFIDGTVEGGTAWLQHADCLGQSFESLWLDPAEYTRAIHHFARAGIQTATHAIGDAGVRHVVDAVASAPATRLPHRVEHLETIPPELVRRIVDVGLVASMQPTHAAFTKADHSDEWSTRLGHERANRAWSCRDIREAGGVLVLGSDWPVAGYDAREVLSYARLRRPPGSNAAPVLPDQALTGLMALEGMTTQAAIADGSSATGGRIAVGSRADLTALTLDPVTAPPDELAESPVPLTMVAGRVVHRTC